jgi:hypothetical protein
LGRQREIFLLFCGRPQLESSAGSETVDDLLHEEIGRRRSGGHADGDYSFQPSILDVVS